MLVFLMNHTRTHFNGVRTKKIYTINYNTFIR